MATIHEELLRQLDYDPNTGIFRWKVTTNNRAKVGSVAGTYTLKGYRQIKFNGKSWRAGRLAWFYVHGVEPTHAIDHINHIKDDDRIDNLRDATGTEQQRNLPLFSTNSTGHHNISWDKVNLRYKVSVREKGNKSSTTVGRFSSLKKAISARDVALSINNYHTNHGERVASSQQ